MKHTEFLSLEELCTQLSISLATGRNWLRLGKISSDVSANGQPFFSFSTFQSLKTDLEHASSQLLKSRRNKSLVSGNSIYKSYAPNMDAQSEVQQTLLLFKEICSDKHELEPVLLSAILAECSLQLFCKDSNKTCLLPSYLAGSHQTECPKELLYFFLQDQALPSLCEQFQALFSISYHFRAGEDLLGFLYQSLSSLGKRKQKGAYYTPITLSKQISCQASGNAILDPSCGTGSFLIPLCYQLPVESLYGYDIDPISIAITRINIALHSGCRDIHLLQENFKQEDFLKLSSSEKHFDYILGNPPWGGVLSSIDLAYCKKNFSSCNSGKPETFALFVEQGLSLLSPKGSLHFLLPEAILQVKKHQRIREVLCEQATIEEIIYLGDVFYQVQCPCISLKVSKLPKTSSRDFLTCTQVKVTTPTDNFVISERQVSSHNFCLYLSEPLWTLRQRLDLLPHSSLKNQATFGLGIVSGNNKVLLSDSPTPDLEPILTGKEIYPYVYQTARFFTKYNKAAFQQAAPLELYRASEKLLYRFIGNSPVVSYDCKQHLTLNSCNFFIPKIQGLDTKYILALLNSTVLQFYFRSTFSTMKILRSQLEELPLAIPSPNQQKRIIGLVDLLLKEKEEAKLHSYQEKIDNLVYQIYQVTPEEIQLMHAFLQR